MRNSKYFLISLAALIFITVSIVFLSIWGYRAFFAENSSRIVRDTIYAPVKNANDQSPAGETLQTVVHNPLSTDTSELQEKLVQLEQLQNEIKVLLNKQKAPDSATASQKIRQLEENLKSLESENKSIIAKNKQLEKAVTKLGRKESTVPQPKEKDKTLPTDASIETPVIVSNVNLFALAGDMSVTSDASGANFLRGSFFVKATGISSGELMAVVVDPDGKVLINGPWESGYFDSPDGRKLYSVRLHFDKPEQRINFSLSTNNLKQGTYSLQIYFKGILIATLKKTFS